MAAHNWRTIRQQFQAKGIGDPMKLSSMHAVLDAAEALAVESAVSGAKTRNEAEQKVNSLYSRLYRPSQDDLASMVNASDEELMEPPPGFEDDEVEASFDAFVSAAKAR